MTGTKLPPEEEYASNDELAEALQLGLKLDRKVAERIWMDAITHKELSKRGRVLWARDQFKQLLEQKSSGGSSTQPSPEGNTGSTWPATH